MRKYILNFYFDKKRNTLLLTFIERSGQEDCRQDQEDHVPRQPVPHPREVPSPPRKKKNIRFAT